uniref:Leucine zipper, putative tumor suppressor 2b n=1 Tax=Astyanax mexicanus TaxID=7994 RepID=A0A8B9HF89_ASTMX
PNCRNTNIQQALIRPTAFKPVVPKSRNAMQYLSPRLGGGLSGSQGNLSLLSPDQDIITPVATERRSSYSGARNGLHSQSFTLTDSARNSLTNLPTYSGQVYNLNHAENTKPVLNHGHSNSDSGRSSSSKSTGSLGGRSQPGVSDMGSGGPSPPPIEAYEAIVRDLEEKLRERELELQHLRENLDDNEVAICQVTLTELSCEAERRRKINQILSLLSLSLSLSLTSPSLTSLSLTSLTSPSLSLSLSQVCQKSGEISLLKQQLKDLQADLAQRVGEVVTLRGQLREVRAELQSSQSQLQEAHTHSRTRTLELEVCENELQRHKSENELLREKMNRLEEELTRLRDTLSEYMEAPPLMHTPEAGLSPGYRGGGGAGGGAMPEDQRLGNDGEEVKGQRESSRQNADRLKAELSRERQLVEDQAAAFESERRCWEEEKDKVIRYQKQLQQNYVQMYRRNRELEAALRDLSLELEKREQDDESSGNEITFDDVAATEI